MCVLPLHLAPRWHGPWKEVPGDALLSELGSHQRSRQGRMSREEGTVGPVPLFPPGGGGQGWTWVCWADPDDGLVLGCLVLRGVEGRELLLLTSCWLEEDEMRQVHCRHCYPPLSGLEWSCSTASTFNTVFHAISRICEQHRRYRFNVGALAHFHCSSSTQHEQTLWQD